MQFRKLSESRYFPPVSPNGVVLGRQFQSGAVEELFEITDAGIICMGISYPWSSINGMYVDDDVWKLQSDRYASGGLEYSIHGVLLIPHGETKAVRDIQGYGIPYAVINRVAFEYPGPTGGRT